MTHILQNKQKRISYYGTSCILMYCAFIIPSFSTAHLQCVLSPNEPYLAVQYAQLLASMFPQQGMVSGEQGSDHTATTIFSQKCVGTMSIQLQAYLA